MHAVSYCDMTSYPHAKANTNALNTLLTEDFSECTGGNGHNASRSVGDGRNIVFHRTVWSATGDIRGVCPLHTFHQEEEKSQSQSPVSNINQLVSAHAGGHIVLRCPTLLPCCSTLYHIVATLW